MRIARNYKKILLTVLLVFTVLSSYGVGQNTKAVAISEDKLDKTKVETNSQKTSALEEYTLGNNTAVYDAAADKITFNQTPNQGSTFLKMGMCWLVSGNGKTCPATQLVDVNNKPLTTAGGANIYIKNPGALASVLRLNDSMRNNPPASGVVYAQGEWNKITKGYKAQAAPADTWVYYPGLGFSILNPVEKYWVVSRNIAYIAMIFIMVLVAFLVAFRSNFGGQTQVTIANSIPNIIMALVMISISFPLSGFAIDLITIGTNAAQQVLVQNTFSPGYEDVWNKTEIDTLFVTVGGEDLVSQKLQNPKNNLQPDDKSMSVWQIFSTSSVNLTDKDAGAVASIIPNQTFVGNVMETILESFAEAGIANLFFQLVFVIAAFMASLKLFFKLLTKYLTLILYPIISPFLMLSVAIPGRGTKTITGYFKTLLSAALAFVAVYAVFLFIIVLGHDTGLNPGSGVSTTGLNYMPPLLGYSSVDAGTGAALSDYLKMLLAFGLFLATPAIPDVIDQSLNVISFNEVRSGQVLRNSVLQNADAQGMPFMRQPGGVAGGIAQARGVVGRVWKQGESSLGYDTSKEQKK